MKQAFPYRGEYFSSAGMSLRDYFGGQALAGIMTNPNMSPLNRDYDALIIDRAVDLADQLCAALREADTADAKWPSPRPSSSIRARPTARSASP